MIDCCSQPGLMAFEDGKKKLLDAITPISNATANLDEKSNQQSIVLEEIVLEDALGRVLAESVYAKVDVPPMDNSAMDGYAFAQTSLDETADLILVGESFAGHPFQGRVDAGQCVRIMTGAMMPEGTDTVVMQENVSVCDTDNKTHAQSSHCSTNESSQLIHVNHKTKYTENVREKGSAVKSGALVFASGKKLAPQDLGLLASLGVAKVNVVRKVRVAVISTGDELQSAGTELAPGQIYESNSIAIANMLKKLGADVSIYKNVADCKDAITKVLNLAKQSCDMIITSGGVSVGDADYVKEVIESIGKIEFWKLAIKPGKPFTFGTIDNAYFIGLPGNPVSAIVTFYLLGVAAVEKLQGLPVSQPLRMTAILDNDLRKKPGRMDFQRGVFRMNTETNKIHVASVGNQGSGIVTSMSSANCFVVLEREQGNCAAGDSVTIEVFQSCLLG
jgi:molybdopterin molybdotransferase